VDIKELVYELTKSVRNKVFPHLGKPSSRRTVDIAVGGDATFAIDEVAEEDVMEFLKKEGNIAYYSEDKGLVVYGKPKYVLIVDPIDGTRPAAAGFESACVSIAAAEYVSEPKIKDVFLGCVQEIKSGKIFLAEKGTGLEIEEDNREVDPILSSNTGLNSLFWSIGFRGRPAKELITVLGDLVDISSVDGGVFDIGSASYSMTRLVTGQLDAYIDIGKRMIDEAPEVKAIFERVGRGYVLNNNPYDIAASVLIVSEAGGIVTDGYGKPIDDYPVLGSGLKFQISCVAAGNMELHKKVIREIDAGIEKLKLLPKL